MSSCLSCCVDCETQQQPPSSKQSSTHQAVSDLAAGYTVCTWAGVKKRGWRVRPQRETHGTLEGTKGSITLAGLHSVPCYTSKPEYQQRHSAPHRQQKAGL